MNFISDLRIYRVMYNIDIKSSIITFQRENYIIRQVKKLGMGVDNEPLKQRAKLASKRAKILY